METLVFSISSHNMRLLRISCHCMSQWMKGYEIGVSDLIFLALLGLADMLSWIFGVSFIFKMIFNMFASLKFMLVLYRVFVYHILASSMT